MEQRPGDLRAFEDGGFGYRRLGEAEILCADAVPLTRLAAEIGTPFYAYAAGGIRARYQSFAQAVAPLKATICYALKANDNPSILRLYARLKAGADVVSGGELRRALEAGIPAKRVIFSGVGKSEGEIRLALSSGIAQFNVESEPELRAIAAIADELRLAAPVAFRVNPDVAAETHDKISTGRGHDKFGIALEDTETLYRAVQNAPWLKTVGLAVHIGSQVTSLSPFERAFGRLVELARRLRAQGLPIQRLDLGGGLGIRYDGESPPALADYAALIARLTEGLDLELALEPGRALIGPAGVLVARVLYVKRSPDRRFVVLDAAMNDLLRPALYEARHPVALVAAPRAGAQTSPCDLVGPVCESGDTFARDVMLPELAPGDLLALGAAGAYGAVMASTYNARPLVPELLVDGKRSALIRVRPSAAEMDSLFRLPPWLAR